MTRALGGENYRFDCAGFCGSVERCAEASTNHESKISHRLQHFSLPTHLFPQPRGFAEEPRVVETTVETYSVKRTCNYVFFILTYSYSPCVKFVFIKAGISYIFYTVLVLDDITIHYLHFVILMSRKYDFNVYLVVFNVYKDSYVLITSEIYIIKNLHHTLICSVLSGIRDTA